MSSIHTFFACATCLADPDSQVAQAANMAILFMVVVVAVVLGFLIKIIFNFARRQREQHNSLP